MPDPTTYTVRSSLTGAFVCGSYDDLADAERERDRLNKEAQTGRREKAAYSRELVADRVTNYQERLRCARCAREPKLDKDGVLACPACKSTEFEVGELVPLPIKHAGLPMTYEIQTSAGLVV